MSWSEQSQGELAECYPADYTHRVLNVSTTHRPHSSMGSLTDCSSVMDEDFYHVYSPPPRDGNILCNPVSNLPSYEYIEDDNGEFTGWSTLPGSDVIYVPRHSTSFPDYLQPAPHAIPRRNQIAFSISQHTASKDEFAIKAPSKSRLLKTVEEFKKRRKPLSKERDTKGFGGVGIKWDGQERKGVGLSNIPSAFN